VHADDAIVKVADGPERLTIAQVDALLYLPGKSGALLERALRVPALSEGWQQSFRELLTKAPAAPAWSGFRPLRVAEIRRESATIASFLLVPTDELAPSPTATAGQYLTVRTRPDPDAPALVRSYSLSDLPDGRGYRISVKREGAASRYLHEQVKLGDVLEVAAPRGTFVLRDGTCPVVLLSAGVGATPVLAMLHALVHERSTRPIWWLHGARNRSEHAFGPEVDALLSALTDSHRLVAYSRPDGEDVSDHDVAGRLDLAALDQAGVAALWLEAAATR
jgi:ferredoxin-NADP reductase